ncbi:MAG: mechanosensitive ion channel family protein [Treponema sp.]|nr:mechanosensitive ion channel family protein [Candidatus Treponema equifaecale]
MNESTKAATNLVAGTADEIKSMFHLDELASYVTWGNLAKVVTSIVAILIFWVIYRTIRHLVKKGASKKFEPRTVKSITKCISYIFYVVIVMYVLGLFGIKLSAVWGAAGIAGVAIGFAAQTSVSNLISGLFVVTDKAMKVGDFIECDGVSGTVREIGIISVKIQTVDKQMIRIPNSTIINTKLVNYSSFNHRRYVFEFSVDYGTDLDKTLEIVKSVPARCPTVITNDPTYAPAAFWTTLGDSGINGILCVWFDKANLWETKSTVCSELVKAFREADVNIPFNRMDVTLLSEETVPSISKKA